jgi:hypothetical protein
MRTGKLHSMQRGGGGEGAVGGLTVMEAPSLKLGYS